MKQTFFTHRTRQLTLFVVSTTLALTWAVQPPSSTLDPIRAIDTVHSKLTVHVFKSGFLSVFAHNHEINAPIDSGSLDVEKPSVNFTVDARKLAVLDSGESDSTRAEIQKTMHGERVLDSSRYPEIKFASTEVKPLGDGRYTVTGDLSLHGQKHTVKVNVAFTEGHYHGETTFKQTDFGIMPISIGGGSVKVRNEVTIEFDIVLQK